MPGFTCPVYVNASYTASPPMAGVLVIHATTVLHSSRLTLFLSWYAQSTKHCRSQRYGKLHGSCQTAWPPSFSSDVSSEWYLGFRVWECSGEIVEQAEQGWSGSSPCSQWQVVLPEIREGAGSTVCSAVIGSNPAWSLCSRCGSGNLCTYDMEFNAKMYSLPLDNPNMRSGPAWEGQ